MPRIILIGTMLALGACGGDPKDPDGGGAAAETDGAARDTVDTDPSDDPVDTDTDPDSAAPPDRHTDPDSAVLPDSDTDPVAPTGDSSPPEETGPTDAPDTAPPPVLFPAGLTPCALAYASVTDTVWLLPCSGADLTGFDSSGVSTTTLPRPGETTNDVDLEVAPTTLTLGSTTVPAGHLLVINGETGVTEVYAVDPTTGVVLGTLTTAYGDSHVVGGAWHPDRGTLFFVQDRQPRTDPNQIAEIDPVSGAVLARIPLAGIFSVNYGDVEVCPSTGHLLVVSSDETTIAELDPSGTLLASHPLPAGVSGASGIGVDDTTGVVWVAGTNGGIGTATRAACPPGP